MLFLLFFTLVVSYYLWQWIYWRRRGFPGPLGIPFYGVLNETFNGIDPPFRSLQKWTKQYGSIYGITEGLSKTIVISDVELINEVFVKQFDNFYGRRWNPLQGDPEKDKRVHLLSAQGHRWKRLRNISSPTFSNNSLKKIRGSVEECALELMRHIENGINGGSDIDMLRYYQEYTLDVIGRIAMGEYESKMFKNPMLPEIKSIFMSDRRRIMSLGFIFPFLAASLREIGLRVNFLGIGMVGRIFKTVRDAIDRRVSQRADDSRNGIELGEPADFIDMFLDARADTDFINEDNHGFTKQSGKVSRELTVEEIVAQCFVFLAAGFDTTALSLSYATYLLATHPRVMRKLQEEIDRQCPDPSISFEQLSNLTYFNHVVKETLRLYPLAALVNARKCMHSTKIGEYKIEKGENILIDTWSVHYDPKIWGDDVGEFKPERWENGDENAYKCAYLPFGLGPRQCIGMRLAQMEEKLLLAHILKKYSFEVGKRTQIPLKLVGRATTQPENVFLHLIPRY